MGVDPARLLLLDIFKRTSRGEHGAVGVIIVWDPDYEQSRPLAAHDPPESACPRYALWRNKASRSIPFRNSTAHHSQFGEGKRNLQSRESRSRPSFKDAEADNGKSFDLPITPKSISSPSTKRLPVRTSSPCSRAPIPSLKMNTLCSARISITWDRHSGQWRQHLQRRLRQCQRLGRTRRDCARIQQASHRTQRSLIFLNDTGEEKGLQGAYYFAFNPTVPVEKIVANINMDELNSFFPLKDVVGFGAEHTSMKADLDAAAKVVGYQVTPILFPKRPSSSAATSSRSSAAEFLPSL